MGFCLSGRSPITRCLALSLGHKFKNRYGGRDFYPSISPKMENIALNKNKKTLFFQ